MKFPRFGKKQSVEDYDDQDLLEEDGGADAYEPEETAKGSARRYSGRFGSLDDPDDDYTPRTGRRAERYDDYEDDLADDGYEDDYEDDYDEGAYVDDGYADDESYAADDGYADDESYADDERYADDDQDAYYDEDEYAQDDAAYGDESGDYAPRGGFIAAVSDFVYAHDWVTYALLFVLPPLGIYLMWRKGSFEKQIRLAITAASALWFVVLIVLLVLNLGPGRDNRQTVTALPTLAPTVVATVPEQTEAIEATSVPEATQVPVATDAPAAQPSFTEAPGALVYSSPTGVYYHNNDTCPMIQAGETMSRVSLENAQNRGKFACPICYSLDAYYVTEMNNYYHSNRNCSGMTDGTPVTKEQAEAAGKDPCPVCVTQITDVLMDVVEGSTKLVDLATEDKSGIQVWYTAGGDNFHIKENCRGMQGASLHPLKEALLGGKTACQTCCPEAGKAVYCTKTGTWYHKISNCQGMSGATQVPLAEALVMGKTECPECRPNNGEGVMLEAVRVADASFADAPWVREDDPLGLKQMVLLTETDTFIN